MNRALDWLIFLCGMCTCVIHTVYWKCGVQILKLYLKHLLNVVIFRLQQFAPGSQVAVGQDPPGFQQPVGVTLESKSDPTQHQSDLHSCQNMAQKKRHIYLTTNDTWWMSEINSEFSWKIPALILTTYLNKVKLVSVPFFLWQRVRVIENTCWRRVTRAEVTWDDKLKNSK